MRSTCAGGTTYGSKLSGASDASLTGYGSTLAQMSEENRLMPLAFNSGHFTMTEQRRPSIVREADGIARATHEYRWCLLGTEFDFFLISDCMPVEHARKAKSINNGFISRLALSLDEYPGMKLYWRAGHSAILHPADLCSRALTKYDGSQTPEQNGFDGPWQYRDCPRLRTPDRPR